LSLGSPSQHTYYHSDITKECAAFTNTQDSPFKRDKSYTRNGARFMPGSPSIKSLLLHKSSSQWELNTITERIAATLPMCWEILCSKTQEKYLRIAQTLCSLYFNWTSLQSNKRCHHTHTHTPSE